ncbi:MAG: hypothetical protein L6R36_002830 [Xanthoria steineri]|nr:MAG: hypothetical protein L6R36_002830 [Xanthoria steineri]
MVQIQAWKLRGSLPHTIESTWYITEAILNDVTGVQTSTMSAFALRSNYCTAFCRFVTGLLDSMQESHYKVSMYDKARELRLPASFVELRHEAIHGEIPSLVVLRQAAQKALDWLQTNYWMQLEDDFAGARLSSSGSGERYVSMREDLRNIVQQPPIPSVLASAKSAGDIDNQSRIMFESILKILEDSNGGKQASAEFIDVLFDQWMLATSGGDSITAMPHASRGSFRRDGWTDDIYNYWDPVLKLLALHRPHFLRMLSDVMTKHLTAQPTRASSTETFQASISRGLDRIYTAPEWHKAYGQSGLSGLEMVSRCLQSPNGWTVRLAASISECPRHVRVKRAFGHRICQPMNTLGIGNRATGESASDVPEQLGGPVSTAMDD